MAGRFAVGAARQVGKILGARAGVGALRPLLDDLDDPVLRRETHLEFLDLALAVDEATFDEAARRWSALPAGEAFGAVSERTRRWAREGRLREARELADAECARSPADARAFYLRARLRGDAEEDLRRAARFAKRAGDDALERVVWARLARVTGERPERPVDLAALSPRERLPVLLAQLRAKGRYGRVAALDGLAVLSESNDEALARAAIVACARHADDEARLTPIEIDRVRSAIARWPDAAEREVALARLAAREGLDEGAAQDPETAEQLRRARLVLESGTAGPPPGAPTVTWRALDAVAALRREETDVAERIDALCFAIDATRPSPSAPLLTLAWMACGSRDAVLKAAGERLASRLPSLPGAQPARGWLRLAERVADLPLAAKLQDIALAHREPGAAERVAEDLVRRAWEAFEDGEDDALVLERLREAKKRASE
ncbi:MAG: hypothetical protein H6723_00770 [Sandaracinus sp.]|nr:hypothetical protein [Sandaracinus sp.]